jgi:hypothetical protein
MVKVPIRSICKNFSRIVAFAGRAAGGVLKKKKIMAALKPPTGRLI